MKLTIMDFMAVLIICLVSMALMGRYGLIFPEPDNPIKTPMGNLPFFDGIIVYGTALLLTLVLMRLAFNL